MANRGVLVSRSDMKNPKEDPNTGIPVAFEEDRTTRVVSLVTISCVVVGCG
jgi:hypothetical protein